MSQILDATPSAPPDEPNPSLPHGIQHGRKNLKLIELNYKRNSESDYTERLVERQKNFEYADDAGTYWLDEEFSLLYGSPLWNEASAEQRKALQDKEIAKLRKASIIRADEKDIVPAIEMAMQKYYYWNRQPQSVSTR